MNFHREMRRFSVLLVCIASFTVPAFALQADPILERLDSLAREIGVSQKTLRTGESPNEDSTAALSPVRESSEELSRAISRIATVPEGRKAIDTLRYFGYRIRTDAEKKAFDRAISLLESRLKFLSTMENGEFKGLFDQSLEVREEIARISVVPEPSFRAPENVSMAQGADARRSRPRSNLLGVEVKSGKTAFSVYSPNATVVKLVVFGKADDKTGTEYPMEKGPEGIWRYMVDAELYGKFYGFKADGPKSAGNLFDPNRLLSDPYAFANVDHDGKSVIVPPKFRNFTWTDGDFKTPSMADLIVYEMHVRDYTFDPSSGVPAGLKGKYLGLIEGADSEKILGNLKALGVNAVELFPVQEFNDSPPGSYHWGYNTTHYFAPECSYATGKEGQACFEFKQMVNGFHNAGIAVIMDVVYNHTAEGNENGPVFSFKGLDNPGYYRLTDNLKYYWNGSGCGNEFRSDNPMTRKLIVDSLKFWMSEYHVDGFRFDLGTILDKETINEIITGLPENAILVAEPWACDWQRSKWGKGDFRNTRLGKWNDDFRETVRAFARGEADRNNLMTVLSGTCFWWTAKPTESLNFVECHDGAVLIDLFKGNKARVKLAAVALLTAQGVPMLHEGMEFVKTKKGNDNSFGQDNDMNWINWELKKKEPEVFDFYKGLIRLRRTYPNFRHSTALNNQSIQWQLPPNQKAVGYLLGGAPDFLVLMNSDDREWVNFNLPGGGDWTVVCNGDKVDDSGALGTANGTYNLPALTAVILKRK